MDMEFLKTRIKISGGHGVGTTELEILLSLTEKIFTELNLELK